MRNRISILGIVLITACSSGRSSEVVMQEAARVHNETMALAVVVEQKIKGYESDSMRIVFPDSVIYWRQLLEAWKEDVVEVPGNEVDHVHATHDHHDHTPLDVTAEQMLEIQQALAQRMTELSQRIAA